VLTAAGRTVPGDVAVVGFDDSVICRYTSPPLTTVAQPIRQLGWEMAKMLVSLIDGEPAGPLILPTRLVIRESTDPAPAEGALSASHRQTVHIVTTHNCTAVPKPAPATTGTPLGATASQPSKPPLDKPSPGDAYRRPVAASAGMISAP
jgi:hypothetical protein